MNPWLRKLLLIFLAFTLVACTGVSPTLSPTSSLPTVTNPLAGMVPSASPVAPIQAALPTEIAPAGEPAAATYLVLVSIDACRPEYLDLAELPNLEYLMANGVSYTGAWVGSLQSNTPPGHTEMSTGSFPKHNGISGFSWSNMATGERFHPTSLEAINAGEMAQIVADSGVPTLAGLVKGKYPDAKVAAITSHKFYAAQGLGMGPTDFIVYTEKVREKKRAATPTAPAIEGYEPPKEETMRPAAIQGHAPDQAFLDDPDLQVTVNQPGDDSLAVFHIAMAMFEKYQPRALLINLPETDGWGHKTGGITAPDEMRQVMLGVDRGLGELMELYRQAGVFDQTLWVVTADHGMTPGLTTYKNDLVTKIIGLPKKDARAGVPETHLKDPAKALPLANKIAESHLPAMVGVYARLNQDGVYTYQPAEATAASLPADLNGAYLSLLSSYAGLYSPDIVITTEENVLYGSGNKQRGGAHGEVNWADQHIPLIISGPGVRTGLESAFPARLVDIAPTIARLMGLHGEGFDGVVLSDALLAPTAEDTSAFDEIAAFLTPLRDAFRDWALKAVD
jgi:arylsulfatase A-like enzyme